MASLKAGAQQALPSRRSPTRGSGGKNRSHPRSDSSLWFRRIVPGRHGGWMANRDIVVVGGSAGSVEPMGTLLELLPKDLHAALFFVLHVPTTRSSLLPEILSRSGFYAHHAVDGEPIENGRVYVAPPDRHMLLELDRVRVVFGPRHNRHRPAVDPLFRTATR